jgi:hypothetical protein
MDAVEIEMDTDTEVILGGARVLLSDVPLGKEFTLNGHLFQSCANPSTYGRVPAGGRFKYGDQWFYKVESNGRYPLEHNMPFGKPSFLQGGRHFSGGERVMVLEVNSRGPA